MSEWESLLNSLSGPVFTALAAWALGTWFSGKWTERQKKRELELNMAGKFYESYGEFRAVWREWNYYLSHQPEDVPSIKPSLFERACRAEGILEAVFLKLSSERTLSENDLSTFGDLRQAFQVLRKRIRENKRIDYPTSGHADYSEFKRLATFLGTLVMTAYDKEPPDSRRAYQNFKEITDNKYEARWRNAGNAST